jgi:glutamate-1-semialdehyde 2,1-aminomutase
MTFVNDFWDPRYAQSRAWFERADRVIPGGIYGHATPALTVPGQFPYYAASAQGCRYRDIDGNEFIDFMCGYGPMVLGHQQLEVSEAVAKAERDGVCFNHPTTQMVTLAERLVGLIDFADWAVFGKNGSDMTMWAVQVAREFTGRKKILKVAGAYHGIDPWCTPGQAGWIAEDRVHIHEFPWNDAEAVAQLLRKHQGQVAALIATPFHHPNYGSSVMPAPGFWREVERVCRAHGVLLILDDVRAGFRLHLGGSHRAFGFTPDLSCYCKALGNGYPISATVGTGALRVAASKIFLTGSYWNSPGPMAAALQVLTILERDQGISVMRERGQQFGQGLQALADEVGLPVEISGPPAMPYLKFQEDPAWERQREFSIAAAQAGVFLHPHHNWFLSVAHDTASITESLSRLRLPFQRAAQVAVGDAAHNVSAG